MRLPADNSAHEVQGSIRDLIEEINRLNKRIDKLDIGATDRDLEAAKSELDSKIRKGRLNPKDIMIGGGPNSQIGYVPDPGYGTPISADQPVLHQDGSWRFIADGLIHAVPNGKCGTSKAQRVLNVQGSMAINGATETAALLTRDLTVTHQASFPIHGVRVYNSIDQSLNSGSATMLTFDTESWDSDGYHSTATATSRLTVPTGLDGYYLVRANVRWEGVATPAGRRTLRIEVGSAGTPSGANVVSQFSHLADTTASTPTDQQITAIVRLNAAQYVELCGVQVQGGAVKAQTVAAPAPMGAWASVFEMYWLGRF